MPKTKGSLGQKGQGRSTTEISSLAEIYGVLNTAYGDCSHEIKRCLLLGRKVMTNLDSILKSRDITLPIKVRCREPARDIPLVTKVMRKEARHTQRWDRASGVPPDILEHLPPKNQSLPTLLLCALTSDFTGGCPPPPSPSLCQRVNLQLQLIKFQGN